MKEKDLVEIYSEGTIEVYYLIGSKEDKPWSGKPVGEFYLKEWLPYWNPGIKEIEQIPELMRGYEKAIDRLASEEFKTVKEFIDYAQSERCSC